MWPRAIVGMSVVVLAGVGLSVSVDPHEIPKPRWTAGDLPSLPPASENGWHAVTSEALEIEIPKQLGSLLESREPDDERFWAQLDEDAALLREFLAEDGAREANARIEDARREPAFVDACATIEEPCRVFEWHRAHDIALLQALADAHAGRTSEALTLLGDLVRMSTGQLASARSVISLLIALDQLGDALHVAEMVAARTDPSDRPALAELTREVEGVAIDMLDLRPLVISQYLHERSTLAALPDTWLFSHALTASHIDEMADRRYRAAERGDVFAALGGEEPSPTQSLVWWLRNPGGKLLLDSWSFDPTSLASSIEDSREDVRDARAGLLAH